jgi:hypothetical protein
MASEPELPKPSRLWKDMSEAARLEAALAFFADEQSIAEQAEAIGIIARQINFRPKSVLALPAEKKARYLLRMARVPETVAARLLVAYHLAHKRPMMAAFLDRLGIAHENGLIAEEQAKPGDPAAVREAGESTFDQFPADDVRLYFSTLLMQDPESWAPLREVLAARETGTTAT